jgi:hypothetical protein
VESSINLPLAGYLEVPFELKERDTFFAAMKEKKEKGVKRG